MHLKSITLKGFKSFLDRTTLEFGSGVAVIVGPNGSGKSNVTDAVLWALGEQSPLAVRGQSMQDVIFGGGKGVQARSSAEVEIVIDNADGAIDLPLGEIAILRRLDRSGEGEYRLNGARCRLVDVLEVLSDTGLGKEMHSVVSQGRVEAIVTSKPKDRRLLIEEAAGLGKHRKRRRRAQLKLERTQENLDRGLDVEREARSRLRPLKRQAEAAELHERIERQTIEARWELARDDARARRAALAAAEAAAAAARGARDEAQASLGAVAVRREAAERALAERSAVREALVRRASQARSAVDRIELRLERVQESGSMLAERVESRQRQLTALRAQASEDQPDGAGLERIEALEAELVRLDGDREAAVERGLRALEASRGQAAARVEALAGEADAARSVLGEADAAAETARRARRAAEAGAEAARRDAAKAGAELSRANQFLRSHASAPGGARALADELHVREGYELALSAALGGRMTAAIAESRAAAASLLDAVGRDGGRALVLRAAGAPPLGTGSAATSPATRSDLASPSEANSERVAPAPGAERLADLVHGPEPAASLARRLLADAWVVEDLAVLPDDFAGLAVTRDGRAWDGTTAELSQAARGGSERVLAERNRRDRLVGESERAVRAEHAAGQAVEVAAVAVAAADATRDGAEQRVSETERARNGAREEVRQAELLIQQRRGAPEDAASAVRRAQIAGELNAERRTAERRERERTERDQRIAFLAAKLERDQALVPWPGRLAAALDSALTEVRAHVTSADAALLADQQSGEGVAAALRACAGDEARLQQQLRERNEALTGTQVRAQQARDQEAEASHELEALAGRLGLPAEPATEPLDAAVAAELRGRIERLARRREQLGPVNPLAKAEYDEALAHVEEMERQRTDLETALRELRSLIKEIDRQIRATFEETFVAAAKNFEELSARLFPGGRGRLRLVREDAGPRPVLGGQPVVDAGDGVAEVAAHDAAEAAAEAEADGRPEAEEELGVEIEITPAGKAMKRLTLLSGGEKSMTAIAFLFSVFLARPCPFYILDEVEAALDDLNIGRFLDLLETYADRAQFIVVTHQKRTMEAADTLYGVSMGDDGVSKVVSRRLPPRAIVRDAEVARSAPAVVGA
jgi:chromosome segregation protein